MQNSTKNEALPFIELSSMTKKGLVISRVSPYDNLVEAIEFLDKHFFAGIQFHPEFKSPPNKTEPIVCGAFKCCT